VRKLSEFKVLKKGKHLLKKMLAELELDKLILKKALIIRSLGPEFTAESISKAAYQGRHKTNSYFRRFVMGKRI
jgi:hypothetical protein